MAILIPDSPKDCPYGERVVYDKLGRDLDPEWIVLHSLGLPGHATKIWGEADIVVLSTKGFFALEVKGGQVSCQDGVWHFGAPDGKSYSKKEDPWTQAKGTMFAILERLKKVDPTFGELLCGFGVVMPMVSFDQTGAEIELEVLLDRKEFRKDLSFYIGRLQRHWVDAFHSKHDAAKRMPTKADIRRARQILRPDVDAAFSLGGWLTGLDSQLIQLSNDQVRASRRMAANPRTIVSGKAGTGKTIIAIERAKKLSAEGRSVLFLCFNRLLAAHVREALQGHPGGANIEVLHAHQLYSDTIRKAGLQQRLDEERNAEDFFERAFPEIFVEAAIISEARTWDAIVVDEAQDLLTLPHLDALDVMLSNGIDNGRWHIFHDPMQNLYNTEMQEGVLKRLQAAQPAFDDLFENCRNSRQVATQASIVSGIDLALEGAPEGPECAITFYKGDTCVKALEQELRSLLAADVRPQDIVILSPSKRENSCLAGSTSLGGVVVTDVHTPNDKAVLFSTMHGFKGMERKVVLAVDMEKIGRPEVAKLHYAGLSRATSLLKIFLPEAAKPAYQTQALEFGKRNLGR
jgi:hypothetical protein